MPAALWFLHKKISDTVVDLELLVCLSTGLRCSLKRSFKLTFGFSYVLFVTVVTLYHVYNIFGVAVNAMINLVLLVELIVYLVSP